MEKEIKIGGLVIAIKINYPIQLWITRYRKCFVCGAEAKWFRGNNSNKWACEEHRNLL